MAHAESVPPPPTNILVLGATGRVGRHVVMELVRRLCNPEHQHLRGEVVIYAATRDPNSAAARSLQEAIAPPSFPVHPIVRVELLPLDLASASIAELGAALKGKHLVFLAMPQAFSPKQMLQCHTHLAAALTAAQAEPIRVRCLVKLSSFGIDRHSSKYVMTQGPLGEAHQQGEAALRAVGLPCFVSLRPSSFFANFDAYDLPALRSGDRCLRSPLGFTARVNWVACEDVGAIGAALLLRGLRSPPPPDASTSAAVKAVFEVYDVLGPQENTLSAPQFAALVTHALLHHHHHHAGNGSQGQGEGEGQSDVSLSSNGQGQGEEGQEDSSSSSAVRYEETPLPPDEAYGPLWAFLRAGGFDAFSVAEEDAGLWKELLVGRSPKKLEDHVRAALAS